MVISTSIPNAVESPTAGSASIARIFLSGYLAARTFTITAAIEVFPTPPFPATAIILVLSIVITPFFISTNRYAHIMIKIISY